MAFPRPTVAVPDLLANAQRQPAAPREDDAEAGWKSGDEDGQRKRCERTRKS